MTAAQLATRVNHIIHPTWNPTNRPNAARVYKYEPPVTSKRLATSAKTSANSIEATPTAPTIHGLQGPTLAAIVAGTAKTAPPRTWLTPIAVRSQGPSSRLSEGIVEGDGEGTARLYHFRSGDTR